MPKIPLVVSNPEQLQQSWVGKAPMGERLGREKAGRGAGGNSRRFACSLVGRPGLTVYFQPFTSWLHRLVQAPVPGVGSKALLLNCVIY